MSDTAATPHSASSGEDAGDSKTPEVRVCEAFSSPSGNVIFKSSDDVIFRVEDYYLKATSGLFRDMLNDSVPSSSIDNPLPLEEESIDLEIMFTVMTGRTHGLPPRAANWAQAARLYQLVDKYQVDGYRPWSSLICRAHATEEPWEALFLACNQTPADYDMIRTAIGQGFAKLDRTIRCSELHFKTMLTALDGTRCSSTMRASNMHFASGMRLGLRGLLAYNATFYNITTGGDAKVTTWLEFGDRFVGHMIAIDQAK